MLRVIWKQLAFPRIMTFSLFFTACSCNLTFPTLKEKSWLYYQRFSKTIRLFIWHHFQTRNYNITALQQKWQKQINFPDISAVCLPFISGKIFLPMADDQTMFSFVISKVQNEQGILLFVHWKLVWESYILGVCLGSLFEILVTWG